VSDAGSDSRLRTAVAAFTVAPARRFGAAMISSAESSAGEGDGEGTAIVSTGRTPSLGRRMACFVYEATLLFGLALVPGVLGTFFFAQSGQRHPLQSETALRLYALVFYGVYFVWLWSRHGQTLAMQTWKIRVVTAAGERLTQARALARYVACCCAWFGPATLLSSALHWPPARSLGAVAAGIAVYALLALFEPDRQFWHDRLCGTRLVEAGVRGTSAAA
ncbi:MAG: RDD family protein, partial [Pseudomonadota bacterium]|nr:RDD family protein [Pseudomonadota bacterium]